MGEGPGRRAHRPGLAAPDADARGPAAVGPRRRRGDDRDLELPAVPQRPLDRPGPRRGERRRLEAFRAGGRHGPGDPEEPGGGGDALGPGHRRLWRAEVARGSCTPVSTRAYSPAGSPAAAAYSPRWGRRGSPPSPSSPASTRPSSSRAPLESTVRALTWAAFVGCGQTCVAVKRIYVVGNPQPWSEAFAAAARASRSATLPCTTPTSDP